MNFRRISGLKRIWFSMIFLLAMRSTVYGESLVSDSLFVPRFGKVFIYKQSDTPRNIVIMISGDAGWKYGIVEFAKSFAESNTIVIGVDILRYYKDLSVRKEDCYMVASDFVELGTAIEKKYNFTGYVPPVLMGYSSGATLVYAVLAQSRPGTFIGGISLGFCPEVELPKKFCQTNGLTEKATTGGKSYLLEPDSRLGNPWVVLQGKKDKICNYEHVADFVNKTVDAELIEIPETGHDFSRFADFMPKWKSAYNKLISNFLTTQAQNARSEISANIPLTITLAKAEVYNAPIALLFSGDGGWFGLEQSIANKLAEDGIPTIGVDTKKYFWNRKTPERLAGDIDLVLRQYGRKWNKNRFVIIGYSQGAEIVPFLITRLPEDLRSNVLSAVMLSPETYTDFEIHITNMLGLGSSKNIYSVIDEINKIQKIVKLCIFGESEKTPVPGLLKGTSTLVSIIPGDHHYKNNTALIVKTMKDNNAF